MSDEGRRLRNSVKGSSYIKQLTTVFHDVN